MPRGPTRAASLRAAAAWRWVLPAAAALRACARCAGALRCRAGTGKAEGARRWRSPLPPLIGSCAVPRSGGWASQVCSRRCCRARGPL